MVQFTSLVSVPALLGAVFLCSFAEAEETTEAEATGAAAAPNVAVQPATTPPSGTVAVPTAPAAGESTPAATTPQTSAVPPPIAQPERHLPRERGWKHDGFYLRIGGGPSAIALTGRGPDGRDAHLRGGGNGGFLAIGGAIAPGLVLAGTLQGVGLEADFKGGPLADASVTSKGQTRSASRKAMGGFGMIGALVDWYPRPTGGWHTGFATGLGVVALQNSADDSELGGLNLGGSVFGGYDWTLARNWSLGLQLTASGGTKAKLKDEDGDHDTGYRLTPLALGVQASVLYF